MAILAAIPWVKQSAPWGEPGQVLHLNLPYVAFLLNAGGHLEISSFSVGKQLPSLPLIPITPCPPHPSAKGPCAILHLFYTGEEVGTVAFLLPLGASPLAELTVYQ